MRLGFKFLSSKIAKEKKKKKQILLSLLFVRWTNNRKKHL